MKILLALLLLTGAASAQSIYVYPATVTAPRGTYQTVTAIVTGVNDKTVTFNTTGGALVGTNPCVVNEPCTIALYTTTPGTYTLTAKSNANALISATSTITITGSPTPVTTHPRLGGLSAAMLPALRAKAIPGNPMYMALKNAAIASFNTDNAVFSWSCNAGTGLPSSDQSENYLEGHAYFYAFMSMMEPSDPTYHWGCYARDVWMYDVNFWMNPLSTTAGYSGTAPLQGTYTIRQTDAQYGLTGNHAADSTEALTMVPDWLMAGGYLSSADLTATRAYFAMAASQMISIRLTGSVGAVGNYNSSTQFNVGNIYDFVGVRAMGNNYTHSKIMYLTAAALTFNDNTTDDPATTNTCAATRYVVCTDGTAGSLHAYLTYLTGAMLYKDWAHMEDPNVSWPAYQAAYANLPTKPMCTDSTTGGLVPCFGDGRSGESSEGAWYQYSMYRLQLAMLSIKSAGYADPMVYGPQMSLGTSSWWDLKSVSDLSLLTYPYYTPQPRWGYLSSGHSLQLYRAPSDFNYGAWMMVADSLTGRNDRTARLEWPLIYMSLGGIGSFYNNLGNAYASVNAVPLFVALPSGDPTATPPADPRPSLPTDLYAGNNQHIMVRSGWDANGPMSASWGSGGNNVTFSAACQNTRIDHEHETCGGFDILSKGEYITKKRTVFNDYNDTLAAAEYANLAGYLADPTQTACLPTPWCYENAAAVGADGLGGGQFWHGQQSGTVTLHHSELPGYVGFNVDTTQLYNASSAVGWGAIHGVTAASRSLVYLRGSNQVVYYDRGTSTGAWNKRLWINTTGAMTIAGNTGSWPTRSGLQKAYMTSLLPAGAPLTDAGPYKTIEVLPSTSDWEPFSTLQIDGGVPLSTQFLSVLEWGGTSFVKSATTLVQASAGQGFDGAKVGATLALFMRSPATFTGTTYPASGATTQYVSDLAPNTSYAIAGAGTPSSAVTDTAGVLTFAAAGTGSIVVGAASPTPAATPTFSPSAGTYASAQTVTISSATPSAAIYYTVDGSTPSIDSSAYSAPISVAASKTVKAIATAAGYTSSAVGSAAYVITPSGPSVVISGSVTITGAVIQ